MTHSLVLHILALQMETVALEIRSLLTVPRGPRGAAHRARLKAAYENGERLLALAEMAD